MKRRLTLAFTEYKLAWLIPIGFAGALLTILIPVSRSAMLGGASAMFWMWLGTRNFILQRSAQEQRWSLLDYLVISVFGLLGASWVYLSVRILCGTPIAQTANCTDSNLKAAFVGIYGCQLIALTLALIYARKDWDNLNSRNNRINS